MRRSTSWCASVILRFTDGGIGASTAYLAHLIPGISEVLEPSGSSVFLHYCALYCIVFHLAAFRQMCAGMSPQTTLCW